MSDGVIGTIKMWSLDWAPRNWLLCDGTLYDSRTYMALFSIIATTYGGNAKQFAVPNLRGRFPLCTGSASGGHAHLLGERGGLGEVALGVANLPSHTHAATVTANSTQTADIPFHFRASMKMSSAYGGNQSPNGNYISNGSYSSDNINNFVTDFPDTSYLGGFNFNVTTPNIEVPARNFNVTNQNTGNGQPFNIMPPYTVINYIICAVGFVPVKPHPPLPVVPPTH